MICGQRQPYSATVIRFLLFFRNGLRLCSTVHLKWMQTSLPFNKGIMQMIQFRDGKQRAYNCRQSHLIIIYTDCHILHHYGPGVQLPWMILYITSILPHSCLQLIEQRFWSQHLSYPCQRISQINELGRLHRKSLSILWIPVKLSTGYHNSESPPL